MKYNKKRDHYTAALCNIFICMVEDKLLTQEQNKALYNMTLNYCRIADTHFEELNKNPIFQPNTRDNMIKEFEEFNKKKKQVYTGVNMVK